MRESSSDTFFAVSVHMMAVGKLIYLPTSMLLTLHSLQDEMLTYKYDVLNISAENSEI